MAVAGESYGYPSIRLSAYFSPMKLVLFDIDGTLLWTDGAGRRAIRQALLDEVGTAGAIESYPFAGKTDPPNVRERLAPAAPPPAPGEGRVRGGGGRAPAGRAFAGADIVIVGDTPDDVACGRPIGACAVAVATGFYDVAALRAAGAAHVFATLADTAAVLDAIFA